MSSRGGRSGGGILSRDIMSDGDAFNFIGLSYVMMPLLHNRSVTGNI